MTGWRRFNSYGSKEHSRSKKKIQSRTEQQKGQEISQLNLARDLEIRKAYMTALYFCIMPAYGHCWRSFSGLNRPPVWTSAPYSYKGRSAQPWLHGYASVPGSQHYCGERMERRKNSGKEQEENGSGWPKQLSDATHWGQMVKSFRKLHVCFMTQAKKKSFQF